jgi:two-component system chemotaxis response regulator CheY
MGKTILIVEDRPDTRMMLKTMLVHANYPVLEAGDGEEALKIIQGSNVSLILTDIKMPKMDGFELLKAIRKDPNNKRIKVVILTASKVTEAEQKAYFKAGANGFLLKPFHIDELKAEIKKLIG